MNRGDDHRLDHSTLLVKFERPTRSWLIGLKFAMIVGGGELAKKQTALLKPLTWIKISVRRH
jgi:hypothetical protein